MTFADIQKDLPNWPEDVIDPWLTEFANDPDMGWPLPESYGDHRWGKLLGQLLRIVREGQRAGDVIGRIGGLVKKAPPRKDRLEINRTIDEVIELTYGEAMKSGVVRHFCQIDRD